jgi:hypothetical protein
MAKQRVPVIDGRRNAVSEYSPTTEKQTIENRDLLAQRLRARLRGTKLRSDHRGISSEPHVIPLKPMIHTLESIVEQAQQR